MKSLEAAIVIAMGLQSNRPDRAKTARELRSADEQQRRIEAAQAKRERRRKRPGGSSS